MKVGNLCAKNLVTVNGSEGLTTAAELMREKHIGCLVVVEPDMRLDAFRPIGVLTDRDIVVAVLARDVDPRSLTVSDVMTRQPVTVSQDAPVSTALAEMRRIGVRRLPVVGQEGVLVGVLSLDDVLDGLAAELQDIAGSLRRERLFEDTLRPV